MNRLRRAIALLALALSLGACQLLPFGGRAVRDCPGSLVPTESLTGDFLLQQSVRVESAGSTWSLRLVSQLHGGELRLVGLDPLGVELFTLRQRGGEIDVEALPSPVLEIPPENLLRDLHRIRFRRIAGPETEGTRHAIRGEVEIIETWRGGRLLLRGFRSAARDRRLRAEVHFSFADGAERALVDQIECRYRAQYTTLEYRELR